MAANNYTRGTRSTADHITDASKHNGLTLTQISQINGILASRTGDFLSDAEIASINSILSEPGSASAAMGAVWTPMQEPAESIIDVPKVDKSTNYRTSSMTVKTLENTNVFGMVTFTNLTAMARVEYGESGYLDPRYVARRDDLKSRAIAFGMYIQSKDGEYSQKFIPIQVNKKLVVENKTVVPEKTDKWTYEPWSQSQFVNESNVVNDVVNRQLFHSTIPYMLSSDVRLKGWLEDQPMSRKQMNKLLTESGLVRVEKSIGDSRKETSPLETINVSRPVADAASSVIEFLQNNGFTYTLSVERDSELTANVNTGSGQYRVKVLDLLRPSRMNIIGNATGEGLSINVNRTVGGTTAKGKYRRENDVELLVDPLGPIRVITGQSDIRNVKFNVEGYENVTHDDYVKGSSVKPLKTSVVYSSNKRITSVTADGKTESRYPRALVDIARNNMVLDSESTENVSLQDMIDEVNHRLSDAGLDTVTSSAENGYDKLPLAAISQIYARETVINALLKAGIDAEELRKSKYDGDVRIVMSDLKPLPSTAFLDENIERVNNSIDEEDIDNSIAKLGLDDLRLLVEISADNEAVLTPATAEFRRRIGLEMPDSSFADNDSDEDIQVDSTVEDSNNIDETIVPLKEGLMTSMAGRYVSNDALRKHTVKPEDYTEAESKWMKTIQLKIASRLGIVKPTSRKKDVVEAYQKELSRVHIMLDDQHVVHWAIADPNNPTKLQVSDVSGHPLSGSIGQLFLPDKDGLIELDYTGGSKGYAVAGYNAYFVSGKEQRAIMMKENSYAAKRGDAPKWSKEEMDIKFLNSEDSLGYRIRLSGFDEELDKRLDQLLTRQITLGIDDTLGDNVMLNRLYKGKDTYMTRVVNDLVLSDKRLIKHLASRVYMDDAFFSDAGNRILGRHLDDDGQLLDLAAKYTPKSLSGTIFDESNIAGLGNSHFLSKAAIEMMTKVNPNSKTGKSLLNYRKGRFIQHFTEGSDFTKDLDLHPNKRFGLLLNEDENKYHFGDPTDRVSMAGNQQVHADSYVNDTKLALMTFKGYTMDDGNIITEKYAERVGREQAEMVADVRIAQGDYAYLVNTVQAINSPNTPLMPEGGSYTPELIDVMRKNFVETMSTTSTRDGGFKLAVGDKLSTFHGNKTTISHIVTEAESQPGQKFEMFGQNPELEVVMPPESIISRLNMGEVQELMDGQIEPIKHNGDTVGYYGSTRMINTEIKAVNKMHAYGHGDGRHVGAQLLWMLNAREHSDVIIDEIYGHNGKAAMSLLNYMEVTGVAVDPETGIMRQGLMHLDADLNDPEYLREHMITVIDPTKGDSSNTLLPENGGYIKLPIAVHLPNMADGEVTSYLPVLPEALRKGQELPSGQILEQDRTRRYNQIIELIAEGRGEDLYTSKHSPKNGQSLLQDRVDSLTSEIIRAKLGGNDGSANKVSHTRRHVMGATVPNSATAPATNNPDIPLDTIEVGPEVYKTLNLEDKNQKVLMWRDPALHAGSVMAFKVKLNPNISGVGMNPVIATPFGGDFDGDTYGIYAPRYSEESQKVLDEEYSVEAYLKDMGKKVEDRMLVLSEVELNTGMDFTAGAVASGVKNSAGEPIKNKGMLEDELRLILERGAYDPNSDISGDITKLWNASQVGNIGADKIDLRTRETVMNSMVDIAKIGAKGKVEVDDEGRVTNLKGLQDNMDRFDRLGYYDGSSKNRVYDHLEDGRPKYNESVRDGVQSQMTKRYAAGVLDGNGLVKIANHKNDYLSVANADREIEKATVAKQLLTASSGQSAIDLNKTAVDIEDKTISSRISEVTQVTTQAALQVKHEAAIVPDLNKGIAMLSKYNTDGGESYDDYQKNRQDVFNSMNMPEGYSLHFADAGYQSAALDEFYGDTKGSVVDAGKGIEQSEHMNKTRTKSEVTMASSPLALLSYNGARYLKSMAAKNRSLYEGGVSGKLVQALPNAYNKTVPEKYQVDESSSKIATEYYRVHKGIAQSQNREIRDKSFAMKKPLVDLDHLAKLLPKPNDVKKVVRTTVDTFKNAEIKAGEDALNLTDVIKSEFNRIVPRPQITDTRSMAKSMSNVKASSRSGQTSMSR